MVGGEWQTRKCRKRFAKRHCSSFRGAARHPERLSAFPYAGQVLHVDDHHDLPAVSERLSTGTINAREKEPVVGKITGGLLSWVGKVKAN